MKTVKDHPNAEARLQDAISFLQAAIEDIERSFDLDLDSRTPQTNGISALGSACAHLGCAANHLTEATVALVNGGDSASSQRRGN